MKNLSVAVLAILAVAILIAVYPAEEKKGILEEYRAYAKKFNKKSDTPEQLFYRASLFNTFLQKMQRHNSDPAQTWKMGINQFSDITDQQFIATFLGELPSQPKTIKQEPINAGFAGNIDWRTRGIVTPIKNQGQCGSCWAFAATAAHESYQIQVRHQPSNITLSEQQLVDCSTGSPYGNEGCNGGYAVRALEYIKDFGQTNNDSYPYRAVNQACQNNTGVYKTYGIGELAGCSEIDYELQRKPMAVRVDASNWKAYASGIFNSCATNLNHAVFLIGSSQEAWTIKNSWSAAWGEQGFIRLAKGNTCGVCTGPSFPI